MLAGAQVQVGGNAVPLYYASPGQINFQMPFELQGQTTASLSLGPLGPGTFGCPSGQILFLDAVSYSNTVVSDATGNSANSTPDPISATLHIRV